MTSKLSKLSVLLLATALVVAWFWRVSGSAPPTINFVKFGTNAYGYPVAVFRATNTTGHTFSYWGEGPASPHYALRSLTATGWHKESLGWCGTGAYTQELPPHSSVDFEVESSGMPPSSAVGIRFECATREEVDRRMDSPFRDMRYFIQDLFPKPEPTWSPLVP